MTLYTEQNASKALTRLSIVYAFELFNALLSSCINLVLRLTLNQFLSHLIEFQLSLLTHLVELLLAYTVETGFLFSQLFSEPLQIWQNSIKLLFKFIAEWRILLCKFCSLAFTAYKATVDG